MMRGLCYILAPLAALAMVLGLQTYAQASITKSKCHMPQSAYANLTWSGHARVAGIPDEDFALTIRCDQ